MGAILAQRDDSGVERVIAYASRILNKHERRYSATEKECLAIVWSLRHFRPYIFGLGKNAILVETDHKALSFVYGKNSTNARVQRWLLSVQDYPFTVVHKPGNKHTNADSLSRMFEDVPTNEIPAGTTFYHPDDYSPLLDPMPDNTAFSAANIAALSTSPPILRRSTRIRKPVQRLNQFPSEYIDDATASASNNAISIAIDRSLEDTNAQDSSTSSPALSSSPSTDTLAPIDSIVTDVHQHQSSSSSSTSTSTSSTSPTSPSTASSSSPQPLPSSPPAPTSTSASTSLIDQSSHILRQYADELIKAQQNDELWSHYIKYLQDKTLPSDKHLRRRIKHTHNTFFLDTNGLLYHKSYNHRNEPITQLVVPYSRRSQFLSMVHDDVLAGHFGANKTFQRLKDRFFWTGMKRDVEAWVSSCEACQSTKRNFDRDKAPITGMPIVDKPFSMIGMDIVIPSVSHQGHTAILCVVDYLTRYAEAFPIKDQTAKTVADILITKIVCRHGCPRHLLSDRGGNFKSQLLEEVCTIMKSKHLFTSPYHPQTDGMVEKFNKTLVDLLRAQVNEKQHEWSYYIDPVLFSNNTSYHPSVKDTPFFLMFGRDPTLPIDILRQPPSPLTNLSDYSKDHARKLAAARQLATQSLRSINESYKAMNEKMARSLSFATGDRVWLHAEKPNKFGRKWNGPFEVQAVLPNKVSVSIKSCISKSSTPTSIVHISRLKRYVARPASISSPPSSG